MFAVSCFQCTKIRLNNIFSLNLQMNHLPGTTSSFSPVSSPYMIYLYHHLSEAFLNPTFGDENPSRLSTYVIALTLMSYRSFVCLTD